MPTGVIKKFQSLSHLLDFPLAVGAIAITPIAWLIARGGAWFPRSRGVLERAGLALIRHHYYEPLLFESDLRYDLRDERRISGLDMNESEQIALLKEFRYRDELLSLPLENPGSIQFFFRNGSFESGDAEYLYNIVRHFKPRRIVEIGSGNSTLLARVAIDKNVAENSGYKCEHVCIEPFEAPWLESTGAQIIRSKVELCSIDIFEKLEPNDILFIDSSHVIRPQGDVLHEYLYILGRLTPGVLVHVHDIFTPYDYPAEMVIKDRRMWDEQYLLEAFLCFNSSFKVIGAVNWMNRKHRDRLSEACPVLVREQGREPGSFWIKRVK